MLYLVSTVILLTFLTHDTKSLTGAGTHPWNLWLGGVTIICELYYYILPYFFIMVEPLVIETRPVVFQTTVQTIYTKVPLEEWKIFEWRAVSESNWYFWITKPMFYRWTNRPWSRKSESNWMSLAYETSEETVSPFRYMVDPEVVETSLVKLWACCINRYATSPNGCSSRYRP